jgi:uncharacterized protein YdeI (YjbR/CyaY-like superfamily)
MKKTSRIKPKQAPKESTPQEPMDLHEALTATPKAQDSWEDITPIARRDWVSYIESAKQPETRKRRIEKACSMLASGKRRPCCYSVVPMDLYKALGNNPKAKARWQTLTPDERRDLIGSIESAKQSEARKDRIEDVCKILASGKSQL